MNNPSNAYFVWEVEGKTVSILVNLDAIDRLESAITRDPNIHGILYGRVDQIPGKRCILAIERLEHYKDLQRVGYYRTVHKAELSIGETDLAPMRRYLTDPASVLLLIRPGQQAPATAGFFVWENGTMEQSSSYREFPLNRKSLAQQQVPILQVPGTRDTSVIEAVRDPELPVSPKRPGLTLNPWIWAPVAAALVLLIVTMSHRKAAPAGNGPSPAVARFGQPPSLDLNAQRTGQAIRVSWNRSNPTVVDAERGVLWIKDGESEQRLELDSRQLTTGTVMYWPSSSDVNFRLEVFSASKFASESLRAYLGPPEPKTSREAGASAPRTPPAAEPGTQAALQTRARILDLGDGSPAEPPPTSPVAVAAIVPSKLPAEPTPTQKDTAPISIAVEPVEESGLRKAIQTIPGTQALQQAKGVTGFTPAKAIQKVTPKLSAALKKNISGEVPVDLRVSIDEEGNIFRTEVLPGKADNRLLTLASDAAKRWRFEPARVNSKPVSSKVVLHFMFRNPT